MDRIKDSGSFDWGSTPHKVTQWCLFYTKIEWINKLDSKKVDYVATYSA